jgi:hypothetical protein
MSAHAIGPVRQFGRDTMEIERIVVSRVACLVRVSCRLVWRHLFGVVVTLVAVTFTAGLMLGFLMEGWHFPAIITGLIGILSISIGVLYHYLGKV